MTIVKVIVGPLVTVAIYRATGCKITVLDRLFDVTASEAAEVSIVVE